MPGTLTGPLKVLFLLVYPSFFLLHSIPCHVAVAVLNGASTAMAGDRDVVAAAGDLVSLPLPVPAYLALLPVSIPTRLRVRIFIIHRDLLLLRLRPALLRVQPVIHRAVLRSDLPRNLSGIHPLRRQLQGGLFLRLTSLGRKRIAHLRPRRGGY